MGLFKKKHKQEEALTEKKKEPRFGPNSLINLKPVIVVEVAIDLLKQYIGSDEFKQQTVNFGSKKAENAFLQGYNYALFLLATSKKIAEYKHNDAMVLFNSLSKEDQELLNKDEE